MASRPDSREGAPILTGWSAAERSGEVEPLTRGERFHPGEMTQQELADRVGVTRQTINTIEGNKYSPSHGPATLSSACQPSAR